MLVRTIISLFLVLLPMPLQAGSAVGAGMPMSGSCSMLEELDCECPLCIEVNDCVCAMGPDDRPLPDRPQPISPAPANPLLALLMVEPESRAMPIGVEPSRDRTSACTRIASPPRVGVFLSMLCVWTT